MAYDPSSRLRPIHRSVFWVLLMTAAFGASAAAPMLTPSPREIQWGQAALPCGEGCQIVTVGREAGVIARVLAAELQRLHGITATVDAEKATGPRITLVLIGSAQAAAWNQQHTEEFKWKPERNADEAYGLDVSDREAFIFARSPRGLLYGCQTLLQLVTAGEGGKTMGFAAAKVRDYPQLPFRAVHLCIFPNTELPAIRQAILLAARYKYNAVVIEFWSSLKSRKRPESAYESAYTPEQIKPLIELGRTLQMEMIPMLNSWGHASGMRSTSFEHVVLDRFPQHKGLFEPDGWSFNLSNPAIYDHLFDRYDELLELFGPVKYFHLGMDEAWGHLGLKEAKDSRGNDPLKLLTGHLAKLHGYFAQRKIQVLMWHDMFIQANHPQLGRVSPAGSVPPINSHLALDQLPKDVIIAAWNYGAADWPVPKYFRDKGYPVVVSPWKHRANTIGLVNIAKREDLMGVLATTWDSLDVSLPSVAQAGVLAWTAPGFDLKTIPYDHWVAEIRKLPIDRLPTLERP